MSCFAGFRSSTEKRTDAVEMPLSDREDRIKIMKNSGTEDMDWLRKIWISRKYRFPVRPFLKIRIV